MASLHACLTPGDESPAGSTPSLRADSFLKRLRAAHLDSATQAVRAQLTTAAELARPLSLPTFWSLVARTPLGLGDDCGIGAVRAAHDVEADAAGLSRIVAHLSAHFPTGSAVSAGFRERVQDVQAEYSGTLLHMLRLLASEAGQIEEQHRSALVWRHLPPRAVQAGAVAGALGAPFLPSASAGAVSGVPVPHEFQRAHAGAIGGRLSAVHSRARMVHRSHRLFPRAPQRSVVTDTRVQLVAGTVARSVSVHADPEADPFRCSGVEVFAGSRADVSERECAAAGVPWALEVVRVPLFAALDAPAAAGHTLNASDAAAAALRVRAQDRRLPAQAEGADEGEDGALYGGAPDGGDSRTGADVGAGDDSRGALGISGAMARGAAARSPVALLRGPLAVGDGIVDGVAVPAPSGAPSQPRAHASSLRRLHAEYGALAELILSPFFPDACGLHEAMDAPPAVTSIAGPATVFLYEAVPGAVPLSQLLAAGGGMLEAQPLLRHLASQVLQALCDVEAMCCYDVEEGGIGVENVYVSEAGARVTLRGVAWGEPLPSPLVPSPLLPGYGLGGTGAEGAWERLVARSARLRRCFARILRQMLVFAQPAAGAPQLPGVACAAALTDAGADTDEQTEGEGVTSDLTPLAAHLLARDSSRPAASAEADAAIASQCTLLSGCQRLDGSPESQRRRAFGRAQAEAGVAVARYEVFDLLLPLVPRVAPPHVAQALSAATVERVGNASRSANRAAAAGGFTRDSGGLGSGAGVSTGAAAAADGADYLFVSGGRASRRAGGPTAEDDGDSRQLAAGEAVSAAVAQRWGWTLEQRMAPEEGAARARPDAGSSGSDGSLLPPPVRLAVLSATNELLPTALLRNPSALGSVAAGSGAASAAAGAADGGGVGTSAATWSGRGDAGAGSARQGRDGRPALMWATRITVRASGCGQASFWLRRARRHVGGGAAEGWSDDVAAAADAYACSLLEAHAAAGGGDASVMGGDEGAAGSRGGGDGSSPMAASRQLPSGLRVGSAGGSPSRRGTEGFRSAAAPGGGGSAVDAEGREVAGLLCAASVFPSSRSATLRCLLELLEQPLQAEPAYVALRCLADAMPAEAAGAGDEEDAAEAATEAQLEAEDWRMPGPGAASGGAASRGMPPRMARLVLRLAELYGLPQHASGDARAAGEAGDGDAAAALRLMLDILHPRHLSAEALEGAALAHAPAGAAAAPATAAELTQAAVGALLAPPRALSSLSELLAHPFFSDLTPALAAAEALFAGDGAQGSGDGRDSAALDAMSFVARLQRRRAYQLAAGVPPLHVQLHQPAPGEEVEAERAEAAAMRRIQEDFQAWYGRVL